MSSKTLELSEDILAEKTSKIIPENIKKDVKIFDVIGTLEEGIDTSDATATASDIRINRTAYINGEKITGNVSSYDSGVDNPHVNVQADDNQQKLYYINYMPVILRKDVKTSATYSAITQAINLSPEKIAKGETVLGIVGTHEGSGEASDIKMFSSIEEMQADSSPKENGLAVVYSNDKSDIYETSVFQSLYCKDTVTFSSVPVLEPSYAYISCSPVNEAWQGGLDFSINIDSEYEYYDASLQCSLNYQDPITGETEYFDINLNYISSDGLTWEISETQAQPIKIPTSFKINYSENIEFINNFLQTDSPVFSGLFKYNIEKSEYEVAPTQLTATANYELYDGITALGAQEVLYGDGSIWDHLDKSKIFKKIYDESISRKSSTGSIGSDTYNYLGINNYKHQLALGSSINNIEDTGRIKTISTSTNISNNDNIAIILDSSEKNGYPYMSLDKRYGITNPKYVSSNNYSFSIIDTLSDTSIDYTVSRSYSNLCKIIGEYYLNFYITSGSNGSLKITRHSMTNEDSKELEYTFNAGQTSGFQGVIYDSQSDYLFVALCPYKAYSSSSYTGYSTLLRIKLSTFNSVEVVSKETWTNKSEPDSFFVSEGQLMKDNERNLVWFTRNRERSPYYGNSDTYKLRIYNIDTNTITNTYSTTGDKFYWGETLSPCSLTYTNHYCYNGSSYFTIDGIKIYKSNFSRESIIQNLHYIGEISLDGTFIYTNGLIEPDFEAPYHRGVLNEDMTFKYDLNVPYNMISTNKSKNLYSFSLAIHPINYNNENNEYHYIISGNNYTYISVLRNYTINTDDWEYFVVPIAMGMNKGLVGCYYYFENS